MNKKAQGLLTNESITIFAIVVVSILAGVFMYVIVTKMFGVKII